MRTLAILSAVILVVGLTVRWGFLDDSSGRDFHPFPDTQEYAALAHEFADSGEFTLHVGPHQARSRYSPGWPLLLSVAVLFGLRGEELLWIAGPVSCLVALVMAWIALTVWRRLLDPRQEHPRLGLAAAAIAGIGWVLSPMSVDLSRNLMSDQAGALFANLGLFLLGLTCLDSQRRPWLLLSAGSASAVAIAIRPAYFWLGLGPALCLVLALLLARGLREFAIRGSLITLGMTPVVALVFAVLVNSGHNPWAWTYYEFWSPHLFANLGYVFNTDYAWYGSPEYPLRRTVQIGHLEIALRTFLGQCFDPDAWSNTGLGNYWPPLAWIAGLWLARRAWRAHRLAILPIVALVGWFAGHIVLHSLYFFPGPRYYCAPLAWAWVFVALAAVTLFKNKRIRPLLYGTGVVVAVLVTAGLSQVLVLENGRTSPRNVVVEHRLEEWRQLDDTARAGRIMPFDPVQAQALGLLTPRVRETIGAWGRVPLNTSQMRRLAAIGELGDFAETLPTVQRVPGQDLIVPNDSTRIGRTSVRFDPEQQVYLLEHRDLADNTLSRFAVSVTISPSNRLRIEEQISGITLVEDLDLGSSKELTHRMNLYRQAVILEQGDENMVLRLAGNSLEVLTTVTTLAPPAIESVQVGREGNDYFYSQLSSPSTHGAVLYLTTSKDAENCLPTPDPQVTTTDTVCSPPVLLSDDPAQLLVLFDPPVAMSGHKLMIRRNSRQLWFMYEPRHGIPGHQFVVDAGNLLPNTRYEMCVSGTISGVNVESPTVAFRTR